MRRARGDGSVYQRENGMWVGAYILPNGKRTYVYGRSKSAVAEKIRFYRLKVDRGLYQEETKQTVAQYLDEWLEDQRRHLAPETWRKYESMTRLHIVPSIGRIKMSKLAAVHVRGFINEKLDSGLSSRTVNNIYDVLHTAFERARKLELVTRNVVNLVRAPRVVKTERRSLTVEQANRLLAVLEDDRSYALFRTLLTLGLRPGEGLGLQWKSVDLARRRVRIESTLQRHDGEWMLKAPKTAASVRTLPLPGALVEVLREQRELVRRDKVAAGPMWEEWGLCFPRPSGLPTWHSDAGRRLQAACREADVPVVTLHSLRHTTPSILLGLGVDQRVIMQVLRHSTILLTADLYTHVVDPLVQDAVDRIDSAFGLDR